MNGYGTVLVATIDGVDDRNPCLLLIDDDPEDRALTKVILKCELGHIDIQEISDALGFAQACAKKDFDLVVLEQKLDWAEGLAVLGFLREEWPEIPVIMFTRHGSEETSSTAARLGVDHYLVKRTGNFLRLPLAVKSALEQRRPRHPRRTSRLESLLTAARIGVFSATAGGRLLDANPAFLQMLGLESLGAANGFDLRALVAFEETREPSPPELDRSEAGSALEVRLERADGRPIWVQVIRTVLRDSEAQVRIDGLVEDITSHKRSEEELEGHATRLRRSNKDLRQFASMAAHELQEPARTMERYARLLQEDYAGKLDPDACKVLDRLAGAARRLQDLVDDMLSLARMDSPERPFQTVDVEELLESALAGVGAAIEESGASVTHSPLPSIHADPVQIVRLLQNLISNAVRYHGEEKPSVFISAAQADGQWVFSVHDNGIGIDPAEAESIFMPFKRLQPEVPGTGLGLATCRRIVERHGGRIWVKSEPGQGSTFYFTIPTLTPERN
jgi:PAS domain S-box-containing protein